MGDKTLKVTMTEKKKKFKVSEFSILAYNWNRKLGNLGKFSFTSIFVSIRNSNSKTQKNDFKQKIVTLRWGLLRKNEKSRGSRVFDFGLHLQSKTRKSQKIFFYFNFW